MTDWMEGLKIGQLKDHRVYEDGITYRIRHARTNEHLADVYGNEPLAQAIALLPEVCQFIQYVSLLTHDDLRDFAWGTNIIMDANKLHAKLKGTSDD